MIYLMAVRVRILGKKVEIFAGGTCSTAIFYIVLAVSS